MDNNKPNLSDLKKEAEKNANLPSGLGGEKITDEPSTVSVGSNWIHEIDSTVPSDSIYEEKIQDRSTVVEDVPTLPEEDTQMGIVINNSEFTEKTDVKTMQPQSLPNDFDDSISEYLSEMDEQIEVAKANHETRKEDVVEVEEDEDETTEDFDTKYNEAIVVIDKTKMGQVIHFSEEEKLKLEHARKITLEEVQTMKLEKLTTKKQNKKRPKLSQLIEKRQTLHSSTVVLPASGYTAVLKGCTPYELMGIASTEKDEVVNQENKWALIHEKVVSTSIGSMTFDEFLDNTASSDFEVLLYGVLCATYPDEDKFPLQCQNKKCKKEFEHNYSNKSLIRAEKMSDKLIERFKSVVDNSHIEESAKLIHNGAPVNTTVRVKLPVAGYIVDLSLQTAKDYIYKSIKELSDETDVKRQQAGVISSIVKSVYILDEDTFKATGEEEYFEYDTHDDITNVIISLHTYDLKILYKQAEDIIGDVGFQFGLMNVVCPHCGTVTETVDLSIEQVLFYQYRQEISTSVE